MNRTLTTAAFAGLTLAAVSAGTALAADPAKELATAATHAGLAAGSPDLKTAQMHLHHVVNCLVGPNGAGYDKSNANPCNGQGAGGIPDTSGNKQAALKSAVSKAQEGLAASDPSKAKQAGTEAQGMIKSAM